MQAAPVAEVGGRTGPPEVATPRGPGNRLGRFTCLTLFTPIRGPWLPVLRAAMWLAKWLPFTRRHVLQFDFIQFVRWTIVRDLPHNGPPQPEDRIHHAYLFFESNFDGPWQHYIDAFAYCIPADIRFVWGRGPHFPGPPPAEPLKRWIAKNSMEGGTYYYAYPWASTRMVRSAVAVRGRLERLIAESQGLSAAEFEARYRQFLTDCQCDL